VKLQSLRELNRNTLGTSPDHPVGDPIEFEIVHL
jgi:hypothetical protein